MSDRDDFAELINGARNVIKCSSFYFNGRIRYGTKGEKVEERLLCMDAIKVYICSVKLPIKIECQFNILSIKLIERVSDSHILIDTDEKQTHALYGLHDKSSLQPFLIVLIRNLHSVFPHRLQAIVEIRPENEYDRLLRLSNEYCQDTNISSNEFRPCGGFSLCYECACDFLQISCNRSVQNLVDTVFSHRISREFTFREFETLTQKDWLPILSALRYNDWFNKITIENTKLTTENIDELCTVVRLCKTIKDLRLVGCSLRHDFCTRFSYSLPVCHVEYLDLSNNPLEDKGLIALISSFQQRKLPILSINLQLCSLTHKSIHLFNNALINNTVLLKNLQILNLSGNRIKEENCLTILFQNNENNLEELHLSEIDFNIESFFHSLATMFCKLRRFYITSIKSSISPLTNGGVKLFFTKNQTLEILQISNANLTNDFLGELCDGLHSNVHLNNLDLRLSGNQLETFIHEYATRFATIPSLVGLDLTGCDLDNEIPTLLGELKKNRKIKTLHLGRNFNNTKAKNMQRTITSIKELIIESNVEYFSLADSKLKENAIEFLLALTNNPSVKVLDIRGNLIGDTGARVITHILQMNRHLHTIFFDRNLLSLNGFEEIVNAMEENYTIQYLPVPITDIILMKITEKDRMEKIQMLMNKLDTICTRNQSVNNNLTSNDSLLVTTAANLTRDIGLSWDNRQQLIGDQATLDYVTSCSHRINNTNNNHMNNDVKSTLNRIGNINKISSELFESYLDEEEQLINEWNEISKQFKEKFIEKNERLSRKFYQLFKENSIMNYDDKFQEQIRTYFSYSNDNIDQLFNKDLPNKLKKYSRQSYIDIVTCLQKRAYDTTNDIASDIHKRMESAIFRHTQPQQGSAIIDEQNYGLSSTLDRVLSRNTNNRLTSKQSQLSNENTDEICKKSESNPSLTDRSPKPSDSTHTTTHEKDHRPSPQLQNKYPTLLSSSPPKPLNADSRKSILINTSEQDSSSDTLYSIYGNVNGLQSIDILDESIEDEGDLIEHDLLDLVEREKQKITPPALPMKKRLISINAKRDDSLDLESETTIKLAHPSKDRPRRPNIRRPMKKSYDNSNIIDNLSDDGLLLDDNDNENVINSSLSNEITTTTVTKLIKSALKSQKNGNDETTSIANKISSPHNEIETCSSNTSSMSKSMTIPNTETSIIANNDLSNELSQCKNSMSTSLYSPLLLSNGNEQKEMKNSIDSMTTSPSVVLGRGNKIPFGTRVLPIVDSNGDLPTVKLRHLSNEKKLNSPAIENTNTCDNTSSNSSNESSAPNPKDPDEQYKRLSVKERARLLTTNDKKLISTSNTTTIQTQNQPTTPRTYRRIIEQVNLFC